MEPRPIGTEKLAVLWTRLFLAIGLVEENWSHGPQVPLILLPWISFFGVTWRIRFTPSTQRPWGSLGSHHCSHHQRNWRPFATYMAGNCLPPWCRHSNCWSTHRDVVIYLYEFCEFSFQTKCVVSIVEIRYIRAEHTVLPVHRTFNTYA